jgi:tyrosine-protein phosphatase SIW14
VNDPANQPVYVHCVGGKHRTGVMTAVYRMTQDGWTADQAFKEMKQFKFGADFLHKEFKEFVYSFYSQLAHTKVPLQLAVTTATPAPANP